MGDTGFHGLGQQNGEAVARREAQTNQYIGQLIRQGFQSRKAVVGRVATGLGDDQGRRVGCRRGMLVADIDTHVEVFGNVPPSRPADRFVTIGFPQHSPSPL